MPGNVNGDTIYIKLYNGKTINLSKLDKLIGQSSKGSVFAQYDSANNGGNANNVFDEAEISKIKNLFLQYQSNDNTVSQDELNMMFGYGQLDANSKEKNFDVNKLTTLIDSIPDNTDEHLQSQPRKEKQVFTNYTVQPGDTPEKLAQKFGLQGDDAQAFIKHLQKQTNKKGWFNVGQKITLLGEHSETIKNMTDYTEDTAVLDKRWANTDYGKKEISAAIERQKAEAARRKANARATDNNAKAKATPSPAPQAPVDRTPASQRIAITSVRNNARNAAQDLKNQINGFSINANTRRMLNEKVKNQNVAYILEEYPDLVTDIDNEVNMDINDIKQYVIYPLNRRLRELGMNKHCIPHDLSKFNMAQVKKACTDIAALIRKTDAENGYVFKPAAGDEGKIHQPRKTSQRGHMVPAKKPAAKPSLNKPASAEPKENDNYKYLSIAETGYPKPLQDRLVELRRYGIEVTVTKTRNGYRLALNENAQNAERYMRPMYSMNTPIPSTGKDPQKLTNLLDAFGSKKSLMLDNKGNLISQSQEFASKRTVTQYDKSGTPVRTDVTPQKTAIYKPVDEQRKVNDDVAADIEIHRPEHLNEEGTRFADSLEENKAKLMETLGITNEQYNNLANIAMGIAEQETHFGAYLYKDTKGETHMQKRIIAKDIKALVSPNQSLGITQIRWGINFEGEKAPAPTLRAQAAAFGITSPDDYKDNPEKAAILTMILLNNRRITAEGELWQKRLANNNAKIPDPDLHITTNDIIALSWNGLGTIAKRFDDPNDTVTINDNNSGKVDDKGKPIKDGTSYARLVRAYSDRFYSLSEEQSSRNRADSLGAQLQSNNGRLGTVIFMPTAYTTNVTNTKKDLQILEDSLNNNTSIPQQLKEQLIMSVRKNEIAFGYGLSLDEASSITAADAKLMLDKLKNLKSRVSNLIDPAKIRAEAQKTQEDFRADYLESRQVIVNDRDVPAGSIIPALGSGDIVDERLEYNRKTVVTAAHRAGRGGSAQRAIARDTAAVEAGNYKGFTVQQDLGVNPYDANGNYLPNAQRELAEYASQVTKDMGTGGLCLTGVKAALESAGISKKGEIVYPKGHKDSGKTIRNAKDLRYYLDSHPEKFEEVKYVSLGNGTSRELNASDIKNLPAGYIGVFIPGEGYENQAGHAFITNGNGQGYADEVDNLRWDDFKSAGVSNGKGEHGFFRIYRVKV